MKTSIATVSISGTLTEKLAAIAAAGFDGVEIFENDLLAFDESPREVGQMVRDHGLDITLFQPFRDFEGMPPSHRARTFDRAEHKFDVMQELGTDLVLICSNVSPISLGGIDRAAADFRELGERAAKRGLRVGYEALAWGRHIHDHRDAWEIVRRADHPNIGLILDSFHTLARKIDVNSIRSIPKEKIFIIQLADAPKIDMDLLYWSRHFRNMPGEGDLPVTDFMCAVAATGYDGYLSLEIFNDQFRGGSTRSIAIDGYRSLIYLGDQVARAEPDNAINAPKMPDRIEVKSVEFIEFASNSEQVGNLTRLIETLGFHKAGQHRSKPIERYRQGDINLVINLEAEGFAHRSFITHGTSPYAIGLKVDNAKAALLRATTLGAKVLVRDAGADKIVLPAIEGVGGSVIYFIDEQSDLSNIWDIDFEAVVPENAPADSGLTHIDHLAETMNFDEMLTWLLFYTAIFRAEKTPMVDIIDPSGIVRSQVVENDTGSLRITMNGAENRNTIAGHFLANNSGPSIQHLAFGTNDIFATAEALKVNGFVPLKITPNYYSDIEARFGLDPSLTDRLKDGNILYDQDEGGEYFQLYSPSFGDGLFFEIVERRGYKGYGAPNSIFRIAAQKRYTSIT